MHALRVRFGDIMAECLPPKKPSNKVIIFCDGCPGMPGNKKAQEFVSKRGYWSFFPRYRGTWESGGEFLAQSPHEDILTVISGLADPFVSQWDGVSYHINNPEIYIIGSSFGGPAAILCSQDQRVKKVVAQAPVVDWTKEEESPTEPMSKLGNMIKQAFGEGYRFSKENWDRLSRGEFYNPVDLIHELDKEKILILHAVDDDVVLYEPVKQFADTLGCKLVTLKKGGHLGTRTFTRWFLRGKVFSFLDS